MNSNHAILAGLEHFVNDCKRVGFKLDADFDVNDPDVIQKTCRIDQNVRRPDIAAPMCYGQRRGTCRFFCAW